MEYFVKKNKKTDIQEEIGFKKGEMVKIYRPSSYEGPSLNIFNYKGYICEIYKNQRYNNDTLFVRVLSINSFCIIKVHKNFLVRV